MTIRRALLLLTAIAAFAAFVTPAAQASSFWTTDPGEVVLGDASEKETTTGTGELSSTRAGVVIGPFVAHAHGFLWNEGGHGKGTIDQFEITGPFPTNLPGCTATATNNTEVGETWPVTLTTNNLVHIGAPWNAPTFDENEDSFITITKHYSTFCQTTYSLPATVPVTGEVTGTYNNSTGCFILVNDEGLRIEGTGGTASFALNGSICLHDPGGEIFTAN